MTVGFKLLPLTICLSCEHFWTWVFQNDQVQVHLVRFPHQLWKWDREPDFYLPYSVSNLYLPLVCHQGACHRSKGRVKHPERVNILTKGSQNYAFYAAYHASAHVCTYVYVSSLFKAVADIIIFQSWPSSPFQEEERS